MSEGGLNPRATLAQAVQVGKPGLFPGALSAGSATTPVTTPWFPSHFRLISLHFYARVTVAHTPF